MKARPSGSTMRAAPVSLNLCSCSAAFSAPRGAATGSSAPSFGGASEAQMQHRIDGRLRCLADVLVAEHQGRAAV